jgi:hypothetical protein
MKLAKKLEWLLYWRKKKRKKIAKFNLLVKVALLLRDALIRSQLFIQRTRKSFAKLSQNRYNWKQRCSSGNLDLIH